MIDLGAHLLQGFNITPKTEATINGVVVKAVFNQSNHLDDKALGGYIPQDEAVLSVATSNLTNPKSLKGKLCSVSGQSWRIMSVRYGEYITHLTIVSVEKP